MTILWAIKQKIATICIFVITILYLLHLESKYVHWVNIITFVDICSSFVF